MQTVQHRFAKSLLVQLFLQDGHLRLATWAECPKEFQLSQKWISGFCPIPLSCRLCLCGILNQNNSRACFQPFSSTQCKSEIYCQGRQMEAVPTILHALLTHQSRGLAAKWLCTNSSLFAAASFMLESSLLLKRCFHDMFETRKKVASSCCTGLLPVSLLPVSPHVAGEFLRNSQFLLAGCPPASSAATSAPPPRLPACFSLELLQVLSPTPKNRRESQNIEEYRRLIVPYTIPQFRISHENINITLSKPRW